MLASGLGFTSPAVDSWPNGLARQQIFDLPSTFVSLGHPLALRLVWTSLNLVESKVVRKDASFSHPPRFSTSLKRPPLMSGLGGRLRVSLIAIWLMEEPIGILIRWSLKWGGRLREVSLIAIWLMEEPIGILVWWSLKRGGRSGFHCN